MSPQHPQQAVFGAQRPAFQAGSQATAHRILASYNQTCNPFTWTKGPITCNESSSRPPKTIRLFTLESLAEPNESKPIL
jgi:hypothetical protein